MSVTVRSLSDDRALFEELNEQYASKPLVAKPRRNDTPSEIERAARRVAAIRRYMEPGGLDVLELGAGRGFLSAALLSHGGARRVVGIDVRRYPHWDEHGDSRLELKEGDISKKPLVEPDSIDLIVSEAVLEHVRRPLQTLEALARALRLGGRAWLIFNLYAGRMASHRYRQGVNFPWPHLIFTEELCKEVIGHPFSWVNRLSALHYLQACADLGLRVDHVFRTATPVASDLEFYMRFEQILGRFPALDLETDFLTLVLRKEESPITEVPSLGYAERQRALDQAMGAGLQARTWVSERARD